MYMGDDLIKIYSRKNFLKKFTRIGTDHDGEKRVYFRKGIRINVLCSGEINSEWTSDVLLDEKPSNVAVIFDSSRAIRGICIFDISKSGRNKQAYIHLICRAPSTRMTTRRAPTVKRGADIMRGIIEYAKNRGCKRIKLSALYHVVGYYYSKLGFRFAKNSRYSDSEILSAVRKAVKHEKETGHELTYQELPRSLRHQVEGVFEEDRRNEIYEDLVERQQVHVNNGIPMVLELPKKNLTKNRKKKNKKKKYQTIRRKTNTNSSSTRKRNLSNRNASNRKTKKNK